MQIVVELVVSADEYLKQYSYPAAIVTTHSRDGRRVRFPANILRPYVTHSGIHGVFRISFDSNGKFRAIEKL
ncbi:MAG: DUF2835 domain-containing protein [Spongiibacteraceae bacterium]